MTSIFSCDGYFSRDRHYAMMCAMLSVLMSLQIHQGRFQSDKKMLFAKFGNFFTLLYHYHRLTMTSSCCPVATLSVIKRIQLSGI